MTKISWKWLLEGLSLALLTANALSAGAQSLRPPQSFSKECIPGAGQGNERQCDQRAANQITIASQIVLMEGGWRMVRTKNSSGEPDAVSVIHVADSMRSDLGLAGLSLQCGQHRVEVRLITLERLPRGDRPQVVLSTGNNSYTFKSIVVQTGEALQLPEDAADLPLREWQNSAELSIEIKSSPAAIRGVIPIPHLKEAMNSLSANCPFQ